jgi:cytochrome c-type biogenesis protein CcmH
MSLLLGLALAAAAPADLGYAQIPDPAKEAQAAALMAELRCLVCQGQSIHDSDVDMAADMRRIVRQKIAAGEKPGAVRAWLIERYGSYVTYDPPLSWATAPLWLAPLLLLGVGVMIARGTLRRRRG